MKCIVLLLAFVAAAQSSAIPWAHAHLGHIAPIQQISHVPAHSHLVAAPAISYAHHVAVVAAPHHLVAAPHHVVAAPAIVADLHHGHHDHHAHAVVLDAHHGASYKAATRGALHTAPLPGHAISQTSLNLAPAPGTH